MMNGLKRLVWSVAVISTWATAALGAAAPQAPDFQEVYDLLKSNLAGMDEKELNRLAVESLIQRLHPQVTLRRDRDSALTQSPIRNGEAVKAKVFDDAFGYLRVGRVTAGLAEAFGSACQAMMATNALKGLVVDLRFAGGEDYGAALATADWFFPSAEPLLDWGEGMKQSSAKERAIRLPLMVLVNSKTAAAAEALAGILRHSQLGLLIGSATAGQASKFQEMVLANGDRLRIATSPVRVCGGQVLPLTGLPPDIRVDVSLRDEEVYWGDPYAVPPADDRLASADRAPAGETPPGSTNRLIRRINELDLMQQHRESWETTPDASRPIRRPLPPAKPVLQDPVLVRALDILKGLAVVQPLRPRST